MAGSARTPSWFCVHPRLEVVEALDREIAGAGWQLACVFLEDMEQDDE